MIKLEPRLLRARTYWRERNLVLRYTQKTKKIGFRCLVYLVLLEFGFIFLLPFLYMLSRSTMSIADLLDESVVWLPNSVHWQNYADAFRELNAPVTFKNTFMNSVIPMAGQLISCAVAGYGLGRYRFRGSGLIFVLLLICLIVPPQTTIIALYTMHSEMGLINTYWPTILPAFFAQGIRGALFMLIFTQFFKGLPKELDEAARIDGAGAFRVFSRVMLPLAKPAVFVVAVFSLVWHWNDNFHARYFANTADMFTMPWQLEIVNFEYVVNAGADAALNEGMLMAAVLMIVAPLFVVYMIGQRYLVEGIERTGLAGD